MCVQFPELLKCLMGKVGIGNSCTKLGNRIGGCKQIARIH